MRCAQHRACGPPAARPLVVHRPLLAVRPVPASVVRAAATEAAPYKPYKKTNKKKTKHAILKEAAPEKARATAKFQRGSPSKYRRVLAAIKGKTYEEALSLLTYSPYRASDKILGALMSAGQNAKVQFGMRKSRLIVKDACCDEGPTLKRFQPRAQGRAYRIRKRTAHVTISVVEQDEEAIQTRRAKTKRNQERRTKVMDPNEGAVERPPEPERPVVTAEDEAQAVEEKLDAAVPDPENLEYEEEGGEEGDDAGEAEPEADADGKKA